VAAARPAQGSSLRSLRNRPIHTLRDVTAHWALLGSVSDIIIRIQEVYNVPTFAFALAHARKIMLFLAMAYKYRILQGVRCSR